MRIVIDAGVVQVHDRATGLSLAEPAVVAIHQTAGLPFRAGWAAFGHPELRWPLEHLDLIGLDPDPEPRRSLLAHLVGTALDARPWWDRILRPTVTLGVPAGLPAGAVEVLRSDAAFAGSARNVRIEKGPDRAVSRDEGRSNRTG